MHALELEPGARRTLNAENNRFGYLHGAVGNREVIEQAVESLHATESGISHPDFEAVQDAVNYLNALELSPDACRRLDEEGNWYVSLHGAMKNSELLKKVIELLYTAESGLMRFSNSVSTTDDNDFNEDF